MPRPAAKRVSAAFPGERLVVPAGGLKVRSNDTDYVFRPHSAFAHLTGLGGDREPDAVLVLEPHADGGGHEAVLYFRPLADRDTDEFFADARYGEFWVGARPTHRGRRDRARPDRPAHRRVRATPSAKDAGDRHRAASCATPTAT